MDDSVARRVRQRPPETVRVDHRNEESPMRLVVRLFLLALLVFFGGVIFIRYTYNCSWKESFAIADQFVSDLTR